MIGPIGGLGGPVGRRLEDRRKPPLQHEPAKRRGTDYEWEREPPEENCRERRAREAHQQSVAQRAFADSQDGIQYDGCHHRLDSIHKPLDHRDVGIGDRQPAQEQQHEHRREHEE